MSNVIQFLESMGSKPSLSPAEYGATVTMLDVDAAQHQALLDRDSSALTDLLGGRNNMRCMIMVPEETEALLD